MSTKPTFNARILREMPEIVPGVFLSGAQQAESKVNLKERGITHILQVADILMPQFPGEFVYKVIAVPDVEWTNIIQYFPDTHTFIQEALDNGGKVLVHCQLGASRSVTIVCAYLMRTKNISAAEALLAVEALRPVAEPNDGFLKQLHLYGAIEFDVSTNRAEYRRFLTAAMTTPRKSKGGERIIKLFGL